MAGAEKQGPCLHCAIRAVILECAKRHHDLSIEDIVTGLTQNLGEFIAQVEIEDREVFLFQVLEDLPAVIRQSLDDEEEEEVSAADDGVRH